LSYLIDTNVLSELARNEPSEAVAAWMKRQDLGAIYLSVITLAEITRGLTVARDPVRRRRLEAWLADVKAAFARRILPVDAPTAELGGQIEGRCQLAGRPAEPFDTLIAATAQAHGLTLVTRNVKDFEVWGGPVFNPWDQD
jgi:hypothetical protein